MSLFPIRPRVRTAALTVVGLAAAAVVASGPASAEPSASPDTSSPPAAGRPTVVLVHGAWADASSFAPVTERLQRDGYTVLAAPNPVRGLVGDAATVAAFVNQATTGPVVLVGHSYGGAVITNAATQAPRVQALAYIDAFAPAEGESTAQLSAAKPGSRLAGDPATVFDVVQDPSAPAGDPDLYVKRPLFAQAFAGRLPRQTARQLAAAQTPAAAGALGEPSGVPAWKTIRSWFLVGTADQIIPPAEQFAEAARAHGVVVTAATGHLAMLEVPAAVAALIERAASAR
ncbi:alpha/beta hydrolase [Amycolatopsis sp. NPDC005961]|uniref:alpha/beta fold hydrolase n=1 Tax=Amycolatopsis sp. NPDC005961 TaxID=3156720 RepID=UPI003401DDA1